MTAPIRVSLCRAMTDTDWPCTCNGYQIACCCGWRYWADDAALAADRGTGHLASVEHIGAMRRAA